MADPFIGEIKVISWNWVPEGWLPCEGQVLKVTDYQALFSLIGWAYGGDGHTTFALPDLRGRVPVSVGQGPGLSNIQFAKPVGSESITLSSAQVPLNAHTHQATASASGSVTVNSTGSLSIPATTTAGSGSDTPGSTRILGPSTDSTVGAQVQIYSEAPANTTLKPIGVSVSGSATPPTPTITVAQSAAPATSPVALRGPELGMRYIIAVTGLYPMRP